MVNTLIVYVINHQIIQDVYYVIFVVIHGVIMIVSSRMIWTVIPCRNMPIAVSTAGKYIVMRIESRKKHMIQI